MPKNIELDNDAIAMINYMEEIGAGHGQWIAIPPPLADKLAEITGKLDIIHYLSKFGFKFYGSNLFLLGYKGNSDFYTIQSKTTKSMMNYQTQFLTKTIKDYIIEILNCQ